MLYTLLFLLLTYLILTHSQLSLHYAFQGFALWYSKMIPALLPFMILSGIVIRMNLSEKFVKCLHPLLKRVYKCSPNVSYGLIIGFLCGFPMGAKVTAELLGNGKITQREAEFLIAFNNNIGPVYFTSVALPLLSIQKVIPCLFGMYGIPLLYGILLRYTQYRDIEFMNEINAYKNNDSVSYAFFEATDEAIKSAVNSILMLCGYMILFNTMNLLPHFILPKWQMILAPVLEITGGLTLLGDKMPIYSLCMLHLGGLSCIAQTNCMLRGTKLSLKKYIAHKINITGVACIYYLMLWALG